MRRAAAWLGTLAAAFALAADAPPPPDVTTTNAGGVAITSAQLAGTLLDWTLLGDGGRQRLVALVHDRPPPAEPRVARCGKDAPPEPPVHVSVVELTLDGTPALRPRVEGLAADTASLTGLDLDGDGRDELLLAHRDGTIDLVRPAGTDAWPVQAGVLRDPGLGAVMLPGPARGNRRVPGGQLHLATDGELRTYALDPSGVSLRLVASAPIPLDVRTTGDGLQLHTPLPRYAGQQAGTPLFVTPPEQAGSERCRATLVRPGAEGEARAGASFFKLPGIEAVLGSAAFELDGRPVLAVMTRKSDKLRLFGEQSIRIYPLASERTRAGQVPLFAAESGAKWYQTVEPLLVDVDADGSTELVLPYWEGLVHDKVTLEVFPRTAAGAFATSPRSTTLGAKDADTGFLAYGRDVDGDGVPDLVIKAGAALEVHRGRRGNRGKSVVDDAVAFSVPLPKELAAAAAHYVSLEENGPTAYTRNEGGDPLVFDLDGDGRAEVLAISPRGTHRPRILVARFGPAR